MDEVRLPRGGGEQAEVDICGFCGGVYLEFFDGEPGGLARSILRRLPGVEQPAQPRPAQPSCPDCGTTMESRHYLDNGPRVARCDSCLAVFADAEGLRALATYSDQSPAPRTLMQWLRSFFD